MLARGCFITGTDTGVGKTEVCLAMIELLKRKGLRVGAMKPVASGGRETVSGIRNADAESLLGSMNISSDYGTVNPYALALPVAPAVAARKQGIRIDQDLLQSAFMSLSGAADAILVEGLGGWRTGLNDNLQMSDLVKLLKLPAVMVVGMRLGCINHAILTSEAIAADGVVLAGWIANFVDPGYLEPEGSLELLKESLAAPLLASIPYFPERDRNRIVSSLENMNLPEIGLNRD